MIDRIVSTAAILALLMIGAAVLVSRESPIEPSALNWFRIIITDSHVQQDEGFVDESWRFTTMAKCQRAAMALTVGQTTWNYNCASESYLRESGWEAVTHKEVIDPPDITKGPPPGAVEAWIDYLRREIK